MCGIAGIIDYGGAYRLDEAVRKMVVRLAHRGPDGRGQFVRNNVALGHARLSIIDLDRGSQPMSSADNSIHITFNGEIYNYCELRDILRRKGHAFLSESDTEVILYAYREWGKQCVNYLEGMFAFAIADFNKRELFLARDPFGIKPLLYRVQAGSFAFASEFQSLSCLPDWTGEIDLFAIDSYLRYQYIPAPNTAFRKVFKLPAGHCMTVRMGEPFQKIECYWQPEFSDKKQHSDADLINRLDESLRDSVRRHLVSDVPFGALLSGGVDSSLIVGYMAEILNKPIKTFSIGFEDEAVNELPFARQVAKKYATEHHEEIVRFDALDILPKIVKHYGEPFGDQSAIPTWYVSRLARSEVAMVLSGDGGDELFAGYSSYGGWRQKVESLKSPPGNDWKRFVRPLVKRAMPSRYPNVYLPENDPNLWSECMTRFNDLQREKLWRPEFRFLSDQKCGAFEAAFELSQGQDVNIPQEADFRTFLPEDILCKVDVASMFHGLEVRPPILDKTFVEFGCSIAAIKLYSVDERNGVFSGKLPLKALLAKKMGKDFAYRQKQGFGIPLKKWFNTSQGHSALNDRLLDQNTNIFQWFNSNQIKATIDEGNSFNTWLLMALEEWCCQMKEPNVQDIGMRHDL